MANDLDDLGARIEAAKADHRPPVKESSGAELGFRMALELISGASVGGLVGYFFDRQFHTAPFALIICLLFGTAAGFYSMIRTAKGFE